MQKNLDWNLTPTEIAALRARMGTVQDAHLSRRATSRAMPAAQRKLFEFAKAMGADTIVVPAQRSSSTGLDALADEFGINVAVLADAARPRAREGARGPQQALGVGVDTGSGRGRRVAARRAGGRQGPALY